MMTRKTRGGRGRRPERLTPDARRRQILDVAARVLTEEGADGVEIMEVARIAGVTRPVIYRLFPTRIALIQAVLEDFEEDLGVRARRAMVSLVSGSLEGVTTAFIDAFCDTIEAKGKGTWHLMFALSTDLEASRLGRNVVLRILDPFLPDLAKITGLTPMRAGLVAEVLASSARAALDGWLEGPLKRKEAVRIATRAVTALLREFSAPTEP